MDTHLAYRNKNRTTMFPRLAFPDARPRLPARHARSATAGEALRHPWPQARHFEPGPRNSVAPPGRNRIRAHPHEFRVAATSSRRRATRGYSPRPLRGQVRLPLAVRTALERRATEHKPNRPVRDDRPVATGEAQRNPWIRMDAPECAAPAGAEETPAVRADHQRTGRRPRASGALRNPTHNAPGSGTAQACACAAISVALSAASYTATPKIVPVNGSMTRLSLNE
jgi:hypothetical protein